MLKWGVFLWVRCPCRGVSHALATVQLKSLPEEADAIAELKPDVLELDGDVGSGREERVPPEVLHRDARLDGKRVRRLHGVIMASALCYHGVIIVSSRRQHRVSTSISTSSTRLEKRVRRLHGVRMASARCQHVRHSFPLYYSPA